MVWWIWVIICIYFCVGSWMAGGLVMDNEEMTVVKAVVITILMISLWPGVIALGVIAAFFDNISNDAIECWLSSKLEWLDDKYEYLKNRKEYKKEDKQFEKDEEDLRLQRLGVKSRTDVWSSYDD